MTKRKHDMSEDAPVYTMEEIMELARIAKERREQNGGKL